MSTVTVHMLTAREKGVVSTRCGVKVNVKAAQGLPADVTGWWSDVTCSDCRDVDARTRERRAA